MAYQNLSLQIDGPLARIELARSATGNRIDVRLLRELDDAALAIDDRDVLVTTIEAEGADFCTGWDRVATDLSPAPSGLGRMLQRGPFESIAALGCVTVAALQGQVSSAGLELALACDIRICAADASFSMPEVSAGLLPAAGATQRLPRIAGTAAALDMLLAGPEWRADDAYRFGLVSRVVPPSELRETASALARRISGRGPLALRYAKEAVYRGLEMPLDQALRYETDLAVILQTTADRAEGVRAFFEKRPPHFEGR